jgi:hypothetical protein
MERRILKGTTPTLEGYPRLRPGEFIRTAGASSPGAKVFTPASTNPAFDDETVTVDSVDADVVAAAEAGSAMLAIESASLVRDRRYLLEIEGGERVLEVESRSSGTVTRMVLGAPLTTDVASGGGRLRGWALLRTLTAEETAIVGECSVHWQATVDGEVVEWVDLFRVVRRLPKATLTPALLLRLRPQMRQLLPPAAGYDDVIDGAWQGIMQPAIERAQVLDEDIVSDEALAPLHAAACVLLLVQDDPAFGRDYVADLRKEFDALRDRTFGRISWAEQSQTDDTRPRDISVREDRRRGVRLTR